MKLILFLFLSLHALINAFAQSRTYKPFKLDLAIGLLFPTGNTFLDERFLFAMEPKYNLTDQLSLGLRMEVAPYTNFAGSSNEFVVKSVSSYLLTSDYFFNNAKKFRPFIGIGTGIFLQTIRSNGFPIVTTKEKKFGLETRVGLERNHFRLALEYNTTFNNQESKMNYISLKMGVFLWGNRKSN